MPGAFDAWCLLLRDWGTWEFADALSFALGYARNGVHLVPRISATIESMRPLFRAGMASSAAVFLPHGNVPDPRSLFARPALADTWDRLAARPLGARGKPASMRRGVPGIRGSSPTGRPFLPRHDVLDVGGRRIAAC